MKTALTTVQFIRGILAIIILFMVIALIGSIIDAPELVNVPFTDSFSVIRIEGIITGERSFGEIGYDHQATLEYIKNLADNPYDRGILLYMDTPGGSVYHSDELYLALLEYKANTGRPVHAYMGELCASGGYYIVMAADNIMANRITMTGSIGVIWTMIDTSGLFETLGIRTVLMDTGEHKGAGALGTEFTSRQEAVIQSIVDEYYDLFVELVADGRNMNIQTVRTFADGRIFTARQALEYGLVDEIGSWDEALFDFEALTGVSAHYPYLLTEAPLFGPLFAQMANIFPKSEADIALSRINQIPSGVPLAIAPELVY